MAQIHREMFVINCFHVDEFNSFVVQYTEIDRSITEIRAENFLNFIFE